MMRFGGIVKAHEHDLSQSVRECFVPITGSHLSDHALAMLAVHLRNLVAGQAAQSSADQRAGKAVITYGMPNQAPTYCTDQGTRIGRPATIAAVMTLVVVLVAIMIVVMMTVVISRVGGCDRGRRQNTCKADRQAEGL